MTGSVAGELMQPGPDGLDVLADLLHRRPAWHRDAACSGEGPAMFFPGQGEDQRPAKAICAGCPVRVRCELAARAGAEVGIWGGLSARERRKARRAA